MFRFVLLMTAFGVLSFPKKNYADRHRLFKTELSDGTRPSVLNERFYGTGRGTAKLLMPCLHLVSNHFRSDGAVCERFCCQHERLRNIGWKVYWTCWMGRSAGSDMVPHWNSLL